jgi:metal-responsive CopG/Arc/MetJ family transcriptional regulator
MTVTMDADLVDELDRISSDQKESRSQLVEDAVRVWHRQRLEQQLIEGYEAMNRENRETAEANLAARVEALE